MVKALLVVSLILALAAPVLALDSGGGGGWLVPDESETQRSDSGGGGGW